MSVKLLTEHHLEFLSLKGGCTGSSEYTLVKLPHCWKSHVMTHLLYSSAMYSLGSVCWLDICDSVNQATTNLAFHSNELSKDNLAVNNIILAIYCCHPGAFQTLTQKTCSFLPAH